MRLEAFCEAEIPMPESGRWANAGMVRGRGVDLAWIVKDAAQHFRVPQRRKRLFLVADFVRQRSSEILFISQSLSGYFAARESERERLAADAEIGIGGAGGHGRDAGFDGYNCNLTGDVTATLGVNCGMSTGRNGVIQQEGRSVSAFMAGQAKNARSIAYSETVSPTLKGTPSGLNQMPCICEPQIARTLTARGDSSPCVDRGQNVVTIPQAFTMRLREGAPGGGKGPLIQTETCGTLATGNDQYLFCAATMWTGWRCRLSAGSLGG